MTWPCRVPDCDKEGTLPLLWHSKPLYWTVYACSVLHKNMLLKLPQVTEKETS